MILYMYIAPGQGLTTPWGRNFDVNRNILSLRSFVASFKKLSLKSDFIHFFFFMILYMYIVPGQGLTTPWGRNFDVNRNILSLRSFVASFKKISLKFDFIHFFFHDFIHVYSSRAGADNPLGTKFWCQQEHLVTSVICYKFQKKCLWSLILYNFLHDLIHVYSPGAGTESPQGTKFDVNRKALPIYPIFFMILYMYIAPGQGLTTPWGRNFDVNRNILSLRSFVASFKKISLKSDFIHFFFMILYMYIVPGQGLTTPWGRNFDVNRNILSLRSFVASFKEISLKSDFIHFFHDLIHVYSPGAGTYSPLVDKVLMWTETSCHFGHLLPVSNHRRR